MSKRTKPEILEDISKRKGFIWQSAEIYGGLSGFYDYGHLGTLLKRKFENLWRKYFLGLDPNFYEIESTDILPESVLIASGHVESFTDPITECSSCGLIERADHILENELGEQFEGMTAEELTETIKKYKIRCPNCGGELKEVGVLNLMFPLKVGPYSGTPAYLRPETAQGAYINFLREFQATRKSLPLGLAIIGKAYRNEISPRQGVYRTREFTQAELQIFFNPKKIDEHPDFDSVKEYKVRLLPVSNRKSGKVEEVTCREASRKFGLPKFYLYYMAKIQQFFLDVLGLPKEVFRFYQLADEEKAFYNKYHWDIQLKVETYGGFGEVAGLHYRTDHDLGGHQKVSGKNHEVYVDGEKFVPHVVEISFGVDRTVYAILELSLRTNDRTYLAIPKLIAPYDCAVFPIVKKEGLPEKAWEIFQMLRKYYDCVYDESGSIGRRYARQDENGTSFCITVDYQTLEDNTVTIRDRDTTNQIRVKVDTLVDVIRELKEGKMKI
ncbi:MAG: glycine--tRNA ligase [Candidatus Aenigmatarchaeota archaeon]|nr:MAG: glycine--tRNA ligase [Candidatus Aenigmarchaeota archaeon]